MTPRDQIAKQAAQGLRTFSDRMTQTPVLVGFDGFVDSIIQVVDQRRDPDHYDAIPTITRFGEKIAAAADQSPNFELVPTLQKLGGNGPIMANAFATAGLPVTYIGNVGSPSLHPAFEDFAKVAKVHSIAEPGYTDALEFQDGKLMLGKYTAISQVNQQTIDQHIGRDAYVQLVSQAKLIGMVNWTMLSKLNTIWEALIDEVLPASGNAKAYVFIDLADPAKRSREDIAQAMGLASKLAKHARVVMGFNLSESSQIADVIGVNIAGDPEAAIETTAIAMCQALGVHGVVVHPRRGAAGAIQTDQGIVSATFAGPFVEKPKLSTGAGDNFNAGFCLGLLAGLSLEQCLCTGAATSGFYVRQAHSPSLAQLASFCEDLPQAQL